MDAARIIVIDEIELLALVLYIVARAFMYWD